MLTLSKNVSIPDSELSFQPIRASGPGGQKVNKTSCAVQLFFEIQSSSLPTFYKERLLRLRDRRVTGDGRIIIEAQEFRSLEKNKEEALRRLRQLIRVATATQKKRRPTKPSKASRRRNIESTKRRGRIKSLRKRPDF